MKLLAGCHTPAAKLDLFWFLIGLSALISNLFSAQSGPVLFPLNYWSRVIIPAHLEPLL